jgi:hypothetical protein
MFCPNCAAQNQDRTKFCRSCGADLRAVALALKGQQPPPMDASNIGDKDPEMTRQWLKLQGDGIHRVVQGAILFVMGLLLGIPLALFSKDSDWHSNWILIWLIFCGWLPVLGAITMGTGFSNLIQSRIMLRRVGRPATTTTALEEIPVDETRKFPEVEAAHEVSTPISVSEHTTARLLNRAHTPDRKSD